MSFIQRLFVLCPLFRVSFIRGSTAHIQFPAARDLICAEYTNVASNGITQN